jgi:8-oxo-dGTP diphosphatase
VPTSRLDGHALRPPPRVAAVGPVPGPGPVAGAARRPGAPEASVQVVEHDVHADAAAVSLGEGVDLRGQLGGAGEVHVATVASPVMDPDLVAVVGAAIVRGDRVLAARRTAPPEAAGRWEFPGGKVEPAESPEQALVREIREELGCAVEVTGWLPGEVPIGERHVLTVALAVLTGDGDPDAREHDELRWLTAAELDDVDWLEPDRPFLPHLRSVLGG